MLTIEMRGITEGHISRLTATAESLAITNGIAFSITAFYFNASLHEEGTFSIFPQIFYNSDFCLQCRFHQISFCIYCGKSSWAITRTSYRSFFCFGVGGVFGVLSGPISTVAKSGYGTIFFVIQKSEFCSLIEKSPVLIFFFSSVFGPFKSDFHMSPITKWFILRMSATAEMGDFFVGIVFSFLSLS
jgi:hypothetical protein